MAKEQTRILKEGEQERFLYQGDEDGIVYCKLKDYFSELEATRNPGSCHSIDDSGGKWADRRYISASYHLGDGKVEILLLSNEHLLVLSNPPDLDLGNVKEAIPELREYIPGKGCETKEDVRKRLEDKLGK